MTSHLRPDSSKKIVLNSDSIVSREHVFGKNGFPLNVATWAKHGDFPAHTHDGFSEIAIIQNGRGINVVNGQRFPFHAGDTFVLHANTEHAYIDTHDLTITNITYDPSVIPLNQFDTGTITGYQAMFIVDPVLRINESYQGRLTLDGDQLIQLKALADIMGHELDKKPPGYQTMAVGHFMMLVTYLSRYYTTTTAPDEQKSLQIAKAISYLEKHYLEQIDIASLAKLANMSRRSFFRAFSEVTKQTPLSYILHLRIMRAVELLEMSQKTITEIAFECGFQDSNYFSRQFKKLMNHTPSDFQKRYCRAR